VAVLVSRNPYASYARIAADLHPPPEFVPGVRAGRDGGSVGRSGEPAPASRQAQWSRQAPVSGRARTSDPNCVIGAAAEIGPGCRLVANVTICQGVRLGARVLVHPGAVIGADGFGLAREPRAGSRCPKSAA
jgi:UDP-3-O-[3-hydroxymyristoyl] glucosamine N-acyltransferase